MRTAILELKSPKGNVTTTRVKINDASGTATIGGGERMQSFCYTREAFTSFGGEFKILSETAV